MQGIKFKYSVDALKVCYEIKSEAYNKLTENHLDNPFFVFTSPNSFGIHTEDFRLRRVKESKFDFEILVPDENLEGKFVLYGDLAIKSNDDPKFASMCFITLNNRRLYDPFVVYCEVLEWKESKQKIDLSTLGSISNYTKIKHEARVPAKTLMIQYNTIFFLEEMASRLHLSLVSVSNLEIAFDSNINFARLLKRTVADEKFIPVINRVKYPDVNSRELINNAFLNYGTTRSRAVNLSYYVQQSKGRLELKCYNKSKEIDSKSGKTYIYKWLDMDKNIHRMEIKAKREPVNAFCEGKGISLSEFLYNLHTGENLSEAFTLWLNRLIHFKKAEKPNGRDVTVFDLVKTSKAI
jgi:hypothetical protein